MSLQPLLCSIPADPDISGIGVRSAIYAQNLLTFFPALLAIWDGEVDDRELYTVETQSSSNLILAFAILISAIVQAKTFGLTTYHGTIVISLSWMNNTNAFVYFILYVQYKHSQDGRSTWFAWFQHLKERIRLFFPTGIVNGDPESDAHNMTSKEKMTDTLAFSFLCGNVVEVST